MKTAWSVRNNLLTIFILLDGCCAGSYAWAAENVENILLGEMEGMQSKLGQLIDNLQLMMQKAN